MIAMTPAFRWCTLHVDVADPGTVVTELADLLGAPDDLDVFHPPGFTAEVRANPDRTRGPHHLDWPTVVEVDATGPVPDPEVVAFVTRVIDHLHTAGLRVAAECDHPDQLPPPDTRPPDP